MSVILASASPRRRELLGYIVSDFECIPADIDETIPEGVSAEESAEYLACKKAESIAESHQSDIVIGSDTVVVYDGKVFGKPENEEDAERMLRKEYPIEDISEITGLPIEKVLELQKEQNI